MKLISLGPEREIGGNCFLVRFDDGRTCFLDCGVGLLRTAELSGESFWKVHSYPREHLLDFDFYPMVPSPEMEAQFGLADGATLYISHPHTDHYLGLPAIARYIERIVAPLPLTDYYLSKKLLPSARGRSKEHGYDHERLLQVVDEANKDPLGYKDYHRTLGKVQAIQVDHSTTPSFMFLFEVGGQRLVYTGDFRGVLTAEGGTFLPSSEGKEALRSWAGDVDVLICEGTNLVPVSTPLSDREALAKLEDNLARFARGLVVVLRSNDFELAKLLFELIEAYSGDREFFLVKAYYDWIAGEAGRGPRFPRSIIPQDLRRLVRRLRQEGLIRYVASRTRRLRRSKGPVLITTTYPDEIRQMTTILRHSFDHQFSKCLLMVNLSYSLRPFWVERKERLYEFLKFRNILVEPYYTSGHAVVTDLVALMRTLKPRTIVATHGFNPEYFNLVIAEAGYERPPQLVIPNRGQVIEVGKKPSPGGRRSHRR
ncbi:MAG: MBL fold metallo-hydrolase [Anaerolineae bacterium]